jgi:hypothetical protein
MADKKPNTVKVVDAPTPDVEEIRESVSLADGAKQLLERVASEQEAKADEPSGIEVGTDWNFVRHDPSDVAPYLEKEGLPQESDKAYGWISTDPRVHETRLHTGKWERVAGGRVRRGADLVLAHRPKDVDKAKKNELAARRRLMRSAPMRQLDNEGARTGMETFEDRRPR